jgi:uncharacterized membrane protein YphA (DoxX/SURF4 family)
LLAIILLVVLRISIGWHLMYEGLWKLSTQKTATPWSAEGYLKNSTGPLRPVFREMTGDPNDFDWLDYDKMSQKWNAWQQRFVAHYGLNESALEKFNELMSGPDEFDSKLAALPPGLDLAKVSGVDKEAVRFDAENKVLIVDGRKHLLDAERDRLIAAANKIAEEKPEARQTCDQFIAAITRVHKLASRLSFNEKLIAMMKQDPDRVGMVIQVKDPNQASADAADGDADGTKPLVVIVGEVELYKELASRFDKNYAKARTAFEWDHIDRQWKELQDKRRKVVGPVQALEKEMKAAAEELLTTQQLAMGPVPEPTTPVSQINWRTMWGLTIFGLLLMLGLGTRLSALGGAGLLFLFYMAMPPWPYVQEIPSIEHNLFVNKVFVEMVALLVIASLPTGRWFGLDAIIAGLLFRRRQPTH